MRAIFVCTGNQCRSPVAAGFLGGRLARSVEPVTVDSAGLLEGGSPPPPEVLAAAGELGLDLTAHRSRRLTAEDVGTSDLVIGMAREHVREAVLLDPAAFPRIFSLREVVRRSALVGPRPSDIGLGDWLAEVHRGRRHGDLLGASPDDDVEDPMGGSPAGYRSMVAEVDALIGTLVHRAWPAAGHR